MVAPQAEVGAGGSADKAKIVVALILVLVGFVAYFALSSQQEMVRWGALLLGVAAGVGVFAFSGAGRGLFRFARESFREVRDKVVFPTRKESTQTTLYVLLFSVTMSLFLWLADKLLEWVLYSLILGWR